MQLNFTHYHFEGQKDDEEILAVLHRHWLNILGHFSIVFLILAIILGSYTLSSYFFNEFSPQIFFSLASFVRSLFFLFVWLLFFVIWIDFYFDVWIVTNERIINVEQKGLFTRVVSELELEKIQDVTTDVRGIIPTFFNYGDLLVQTAGERERFRFRQIPDPYSVKDLIMKLQKELENKEENEFGKMLREKIHHEDVV
ncbi:MAG TPA: PH domain-containing protein [Candidatus Moranbacteria bacterium]|nr:PH domain-containing protein [Candidatus Moranbacteria bacterium]